MAGGEMVELREEAIQQSYRLLRWKALGQRGKAD
jgi:hypothetical protein